MRFKGLVFVAIIFSILVLPSVLGANDFQGGDIITLKHDSGYYLSTDDDGWIYANKEGVEEGEKFILNDNNGGFLKHGDKIYLTSYKNSERLRYRIGTLHFNRIAAEKEEDAVFGNPDNRPLELVIKKYHGEEGDVILCEDDVYFETSDDGYLDIDTKRKYKAKAEGGKNKFTIFFDNGKCPAVSPSVETICNDEIDNDINGFTDCEDSNCYGKAGPEGSTCGRAYCPTNGLITQCCAIKSSREYKLKNNLSYGSSDQACILISTIDGVTIDGNDKKITGSKGQGIMIVNSDRAKVSNLNIVGCERGISIVDSRSGMLETTKAEIIGCDLSNNYGYGLLAVGINAEVKAEDNIMENNGIGIQASAGSLISNRNFVCDNTANDIKIVNNFMSGTQNIFTKIIGGTSSWPILNTHYELCPTGNTLPPNGCGNGIVEEELGELCDPNAPESEWIYDTCEEVPGQDYTGGSLECFERDSSSECLFDVRSCDGYDSKCGDDNIDIPEEECDCGNTWICIFGSCSTLSPAWLGTFGCYLPGTADGEALIECTNDTRDCYTSGTQGSDLNTMWTKTEDGTELTDLVNLSKTTTVYMRAYGEDVEGKESVIFKVWEKDSDSEEPIYKITKEVIHESYVSASFTIDKDMQEKMVTWSAGDPELYFKAFDSEGVFLSKSNSLSVVWEDLNCSYYDGDESGCSGECAINGPRSINSVAARNIFGTYLPSDSVCGELDRSLEVNCNKIDHDNDYCDEPVEDDECGFYIDCDCIYDSDDGLCIGDAQSVKKNCEDPCTGPNCDPNSITVNSGTCEPENLASLGSCDDGDAAITYTWEGTWTWDDENKWTGVGSAVDSTLSDLSTYKQNNENYGLYPDSSGKMYWRYDPKVLGGATKSVVCTTGGTNTIACPNKIKLPFFGGFGMIASLLILTIFYITMNCKVKRRF